MTARDLIASSLRLIGVLASGESLGASEATDGLNSLNDMLDSWSTQDLMIPNRVREVFPLVANQQVYTMGSGGNFNTTRPMWIENALIQLTSSTPVVELPLDVMTKDSFARLILKATTSTFPIAVYPEGTYPLETLNVWPVPTAVNNIVIYSAKALSQLSTLDTALSLPPGYQRAIRYNLALELAPEYGRNPSEIVVVEASNAKAEIKRVNFRPDYLMVDDALRPKPSLWNWMTGEPA